MNKKIMTLFRILDEHMENGWHNGCRFGMSDGPDDVIKDCDCGEEEE